MVDLFVKIKQTFMEGKYIFLNFYSIKILTFQTDGQSKEKIQNNLDQKYQ